MTPAMRGLSRLSDPGGRGEGGPEVTAQRSRPSGVGLLMSLCPLESDCSPGGHRRLLRRGRVAWSSAMGLSRPGGAQPQRGVAASVSPRGDRGHGWQPCCPGPPRGGQCGRPGCPGPRRRSPGAGSGRLSGPGDSPGDSGQQSQHRVTGGKAGLRDRRPSLPPSPLGGGLAAQLRLSVRLPAVLSHWNRGGG